MSTSRYDAVIAGGGLAGLSLAAHLATGGWGERRVMLVDDPTARPGARRWGSWTAHPGLLDAAESRRYEQLRIHAGGVERVVPLGPYRYRVVRRDHLASVVHGILAAHPRFTVVTGRVDAVFDGPRWAEVVIDGRAVEAAWAFDSVTAPPAAPVDARLAFTGWDIVCPRPVFDAATPTLFDFRTPQDGAARFVYVLPDDPRHALVELTAFVPAGDSPPAHDTRCAALAGYLRDVLGCDAYRIAGTESAVLPLRSRPPDERRGRVRPIGARAGLIKASTGYAYERIQRDSAAVAASLMRWGHPFARPATHRRHRLLDAVLLDVLARDPARLQEAFARLLGRGQAERVLRFLDEDTGLGEELGLVRRLPPLPYLRAVAGWAVRTPPRRTTRRGTQ